MGRDHTIECKICGVWYGGFDDSPCNCDFSTLATNLETAASLAAIYRLGYTKGYSDSELLKAFCEDYAPESYFPSADNRPTAERLAWRE